MRCCCDHAVGAPNQLSENLGRFGGSTQANAQLTCLRGDISQDTGESPNFSTRDSQSCGRPCLLFHELMIVTIS